MSYLRTMARSGFALTVAPDSAGFRGKLKAMSDGYWDTRLETLPAADRRQVQHHRLVWQLRRCWDGSPYYRARLEAAGLDPSAVTGPGDLAALPPLRLEELV